MGNFVSPGAMAAAFRRTCLLLMGGLGYWAVAGQPSTLEDDWLALIALYDSTDGENWTFNSNWSGSRAVVPSPEQLDSWYGVTVTNGRVTELRLYHNNLAGPIPPALGNLTELSYLSLEGNPLTGPMPLQISRLLKLEEFRLRGNFLTLHYS